MNTFPITDPEIILQCIPQRHPIVMVDHLLSYTTNSVVATHLVTENRLFTQAYLTEPGLIEHMAQSVALHTGYGYYIQNIPTPIGYIGSISNLKLHRLPKIGECITTEVTVLQEFGNITLVDIISKVDQEIIALGQMKTVKAS